jgi:hypothetical protein
LSLVAWGLIALGTVGGVAAWVAVFTAWEPPVYVFVIQVGCLLGGWVLRYAARAHAERSLPEAAPTLTFVVVWIAGSYLSVVVSLDFEASDFFPTASQVLAAALIGLVIEAALIPRGRAGDSSYRREQGIIFIGVGLASALIALIPVDGILFEAIVDTLLFATVLGGLSASVVAILLLARSAPLGEAKDESTREAAPIELRQQ